MKTTVTATVLVVDDTPANLGVVLDLLGGAGLRVLLRRTGRARSNCWRNRRSTWSCST
ncbi:MAG: hypothetical protein WDM96_00225 [Lacunisphaera sp.]